MGYVEERFEKGVSGKVVYNEDEDSYQLDLGHMFVGLYPVWEHYEGKKIRVTIEVLD